MWPLVDKEANWSTAMFSLRKTPMSDYTVVSSEGFVRLSRSLMGGDTILLDLVSLIDAFFSFVASFIC